MEIDMPGCAQRRFPRIAMEVGMTGVAVERVRVQRHIDVRHGACLIGVLVAMGVHMDGAVTVGVDVR